MQEEAARKDSAVHVSLSSDSLFKQPGDREVPIPGGPGITQQKSSKHSCLRRPIGSWVTVSSEVLRKARHHAEAVRRAEWWVYIRGPFGCQHDYTQKIALRRTEARCQQVGRLVDFASQMAAAPHSGHIPRPCWAFWGVFAGIGVPNPDHARQERRGLTRLSHVGIVPPPCCPVESLQGMR
jgi:hypothetical protein